MPELLAHLFGDYVLQNHWMALNKTRSSLACAVHVGLYSLPFLVMTRNPVVLAIIAGTHFIIDRWAIARRWPAFWGVGCEGWILGLIRDYRRESFLVDWHLDRPRREDSIARGEAAFEAAHPRMEPAPPFLGVWLAIIVDNTFHLAINHAAISWNPSWTT